MVYNINWAELVTSRASEIEIVNGDKEVKKDENGKKIRHKEGKRSDDGKVRPAPKRTKNGRNR